MRRSLDWRRHPLLATSALLLTGVLVLEVGKGVAAAVFLALLVLLMDRFGWLPNRRPAQEITIRVPEGIEHEQALTPVFRACAEQADLTDLGRPYPGAGTELLYTVRLKRGESVASLMRGIEDTVSRRDDG